MKGKSFRGINAMFPLTGDTETKIKNLLHKLSALWTWHNRHIKSHQRAKWGLKRVKKSVNEIKAALKVLKDKVSKQEALIQVLLRDYEQRLRLQIRQGNDEVKGY